MSNWLQRVRQDYKLNVTACGSSYSENEFGRRTVVGKTEKMSLASHLNDILEKILIKDDDRAPYLSNAQSICNTLMEDLQKADSDFRKAFNGLSLSGSYLDRLKLKTPDEFDMHVKLNLPFEVVPIRDPQRDGFVFLKVPGRNSHPAVATYTNGCYIDRQSMQSWIREAFKKVFTDYNSLRVNDEWYNLEYVQCGFGCAHTIVATSSSRTISFDFVPAFEYTYSSWPLPAPDVDLNVRNSFNWFAVPQQKRPADDRTFMVCAPHWERGMMSDKQNLKNVIRLMKAMRDTHLQGTHLSSYMLKTVILLELKHRSNSYWHQDLGTLYKDMWKKLDEYFRAGNLPFFLAPGCNHLDRMKPIDLNKCKTTVAELNRKLQNIYYVSELEKLFLG